MIYSKRPVKKNKLVLSYKNVNKIACIQSGNILALNDSRTRAIHRFKFVHVFKQTVRHSDTRFSQFKEQFLTRTTTFFSIVEAKSFSKTTDQFKLKYHSYRYH